jgi:hypothetical protein
VLAKPLILEDPFVNPLPLAWALVTTSRPDDNKPGSMKSGEIDIEDSWSDSESSIFKSVPSDVGVRRSIAVGEVWIVCLSVLCLFRALACSGSVECERIR